MKQTPFFSIIIPTLNEEVCLPLLLEDLSKQSYSNFKIIHVDGNSDDNTIKYIQKFKKDLDLTTINTDIRNVAHQRNLGIEKATGEWILFMDADNRLEPFFLDGIRYKIAKESQTDIFTTWVSISEDKSLNQSIERTINFALELGKIVGKEWSLGAMIGVKRKLLTKKLYFDVKQKVGEDGIFLKKIIDSGNKYSIFRDPKYTYSVRRLNSEGTITVARTGARLALHYFQGKDFSENNFGYKMEGGSSYTDNTFATDLTLKSFFKNATKKQLQQAKELFKYLTKVGF
jgi:glycosyltransferase involved in cell wall biosynthesis